ncbi:MAG TPA: glycosyltransferase family 4 protein [Gammaproteobacteria bacterium]|nr:glycosyltransferase family 4 protein [Gammaproteobacteria bacterium]
MKIIFINRFFYPDHSATSQLLTDLAFDLAGRGNSVSVITSRQRIDAPKSGLAGFERIDGVEIHRVWTTTSSRASLTGRALDYFTFYLSAGWRLLRLCRDGDVVVAKTDPPLISVVASVVSRIRHARHVNWLHDFFPEVAIRLGVGALSGRTGRLLRRLRNWSLESAQGNVVLGTRMASVLESEGIGPDRIRIVHNWCDGQAIHPLVRGRNPLRKSMGLGNAFVVMYSGNLGRAHDFHAIVQAARILEEHSNILFLIVGDGVQRRWLEEEISRRGLRNIRLEGYQPRERLGESLGLGDVHLVSLRPELEGLIVPSKFYGVAAAGRPTLFIGARDGEISRILEENECGVTVAPGDGEALAKLIVALASDPDTVTAMGQAAREVFEQRFDQPIALAAWRQVLGV